METVLWMPPMGSNCYCRHGSNWYEGIVIGRARAVEPAGAMASFKIHYVGWHARHDEWVPRSSILPFDYEFGEMSERVALGGPGRGTRMAVMMQAHAPPTACPPWGDDGKKKAGDSQPRTAKAQGRKKKKGRVAFEAQARAAGGDSGIRAASRGAQQHFQRSRTPCQAAQAVARTCGCVGGRVVTSDTISAPLGAASSRAVLRRRSRQIRDDQGQHPRGGRVG
mmetsp:Transcript_28340/g.87691  ORF Transcript_28340/g.87691 Transcript_28340/m.87691 type:complete len:223 (+) Transcript_28340:82-750(+)